MGRTGYKRRWLAVVFVALLAFSCSRPPEVTPTGGLKLSQDQTVGFDETRTSLYIEAKLDWKLEVTEGGDWITPDITNGSAGQNKKVYFELVRNNGNRRTGRVTITADGESRPYVFIITQNGPNTLTGVNEWIYNELRGWYYWNDAVKAATPPANSLEYDQFLSTLVLNLRGAQDTTEDPYTIDGGYENGRRYIYSYIERSGAATRADEGTETTFGFDVEVFRVRGSDTRLEFLVKWVRAGSPAETAGLKRGTWISKYQGAEIDLARYEQFWYQLHDLQGGTQMTLTDRSGRVYSLAAVEMKVSPIIYHDVIPTGKGNKVAYLVYNDFESGKDGEFHNELREVFGEFKAKGATGLVLDLRYNPGGYVNTCQLLTSLAVNVSTSDIFVKMMRNRTINDVRPRVANPEILKFTGEANGLKLSKIYVLATDESASASEMVINSIRGVLGDGAVVHIGTRTNGKNVGMDLRETTLGAYRYQMWPITFKVLNARNFCDYAGGFEPDYHIDEFWDVNAQNPNATGIVHELGDKRERLLAAALTLVDNGTVTSDPQTRAADPARQPIPPPGNPRRGGARYVPDMQP